jgi:uncharacterized membrane protein YdjX (TVP38/TMEM64 family)
LHAWTGQAVWRRAALVIGVLLALAGLWWAVSTAGLLDLLSNRDALAREVARLGPLGPAAVVLGIAAAVIASPIPSAPIALAAGAVFGKVWGSVYVVAGAELGAIAAFLLARRFGYGPARRVPWLGRLLDRTRSQWLLAGIVLASRLVPFVSFDAVSYAAGLTPLRLPWFALATLLGVAPVSVALVWFGERLVEQGSDWVLWAVLALGLVTGLPVAWRLLRQGA